MITTLKGDITGLDFDCIVNAANRRLLPGGGVCGAIFARAGQGLADECAQIGYCETGQAVITGSYNLPCKAVIHTPGPIYVDGSQNEAEMLEACYWNSMVKAYEFMRANDMQHLSLAFPCISTGIYGFPQKEACKIAVSTVKKLMKQFPDARSINVTFVCYTQKDYELYKQELKA